jgi:hypothetical protein
LHPPALRALARQRWTAAAPQAPAGSTISETFTLNMRLNHSNHIGDPLRLAHFEQQHADLENRYEKCASTMFSIKRTRLTDDIDILLRKREVERKRRATLADDWHRTKIEVDGR